ncbi:hypothetical protein [Ornithinimicrobium cavernae]|uniref:hypothetical protein n=1 Tax=Ornithinimicrobium cavernae TaxID=2666047 RepID=UPI000D691E23|nr:hypothetical protein [Ornithinimicrobium cavernae]
MKKPAAVVARASDTEDPRKGLQAVATLRDLVSTLELRQVEAALGTGMSWKDIAQCLGVTRQAVHKKYARRIDPDIVVRRRKQD